VITHDPLIAAVADDVLRLPPRPVGVAPARPRAAGDLDGVRRPMLDATSGAGQEGLRAVRLV